MKEILREILFKHIYDDRDYEPLVPGSDWRVDKEAKLPFLIPPFKFDIDDSCTYKRLLYNHKTGEQRAQFEGEIDEYRTEWMETHYLKKLSSQIPSPRVPNPIKYWKRPA